MPNFLENTFAQLQQASGRVVLREIRGTEFVSVSGAELLDLVACARAYIRAAGLQAGDRCALLGPNSIRWAAIDLALMAEGLVVVPLYSRQAPTELAAMMKDCTPRLLIASDAAAGESVVQVWPEAPPRATFDEILPAQSSPERRPRHHHLHFRNFRRTQGCLPEHKKSRPHAFLHHRLDRSPR